MSQASRVHPGLGSLMLNVALSVALVALACVAKYALLEYTSDNAGFVIFVPAVAVAAWYRGLLTGVTTTLLGAVADAFLFEQSAAGPVLAAGPYVLRMGVFVVGGAAVSFLTDRLRRDRDRARSEAIERQRLIDETAATHDELARLMEAERRAADLRDAFNSIISHELRTPITAIYGGTKLLARRDRALDESTRQELLEDLEHEADRLYRLVEDLLVLSRSERGTIERADDPVLLQRVAERVVKSEQSRWPAVNFEAVVEAAATARGDETYVEQVLRNLLSNAAKYGPAGSVVRVVVDETPEGVRTRVLDEGPGIEPDEATRLFELYYRSPATSGAASGAGIGLFVCRALVEAMGGRIWAMSRPEGGAEFGLVLARHDEDEGGFGEGG